MSDTVALPLDADGIPINIDDLLYWKDDDTGYKDYMKVAWMTYYGNDGDGVPIWDAHDEDEEYADNLTAAHHATTTKSLYGLLLDIVQADEEHDDDLKETLLDAVIEKVRSHQSNVDNLFKNQEAR